MTATVLDKAFNAALNMFNNPDMNLDGKTLQVAVVSVEYLGPDLGERFAAKYAPQYRRAEWMEFAIRIAFLINRIRRNRK